MSGLFSGLNAAVSGLQAYGKRVSLEADNISRSGAVAAKEREAIVFDVNSGSSVQSYAPGGVGTTVSQYITTVGGLVPSKVGTHMALSGQGFFVTKSAPTANGVIGYTRVGTFAPDKNGDFVNTSGQYLQGWPTDANGNVTVGDIITTSGMTTISTQGLTGAPVPTSTLSFQTEVPGGAPVAPAVFNTVPTQVIDALGVSHSVEFRWAKTNEVAGTSQTWTVTVFSADGAPSAPYAAGMTVLFDNNGMPTQFNGAATPPPNLTMTWTSAAAPSVLTIDMGTLAGGVFTGGPTAAVPDFNGSKFTSDGLEAGDFIDASIDPTTGVISARYSNSNVVPFAKIPLAMFANANELIEGMGGVFKASALSGAYSLTNAGENGAGEIRTSNYEQSTVDATEQFTKLVVDQTNYSGNLKSISTISEMFKAIFQSI